MADISNQRIVLIGGAGFIGHNIAIELAQKGAQVFVVDSMQVNNLLTYISEANKDMPHRKLYLNLINERFELMRKLQIPLIVQDARDYPALCKTLMEIKPTVAIHLAAVAHANLSNKDPYSTFDHSLRTLENALDGMRGNVEHFIFFSSSMVYGNFPDGYVTEETACNPIGIYGALKLAGEKIVTAYNQVFDLPYTIVRPSALYGPRCVSRRVGQIFIENALSGLEISVHGDGTDRLDFTYIGDLVQGVERIIESDKARNQIFNITYGESRSMREMADLLESQFPEVKVKYLPREKFMPARGTLSVEKARNLIGYEPQYPLQRGFVEYIEWYREVFARKPASKNASLNA